MIFYYIVYYYGISIIKIIYTKFFKFKSIVCNICKKQDKFLLSSQSITKLLDILLTRSISLFDHVSTSTYPFRWFPLSNALIRENAFPFCIANLVVVASSKDCDIDKALSDACIYCIYYTDISYHFVCCTLFEYILIKDTWYNNKLFCFSYTFFSFSV